MRLTHDKDNNLAMNRSSQIETLICFSSITRVEKSKILTIYKVGWAGPCQVCFCMGQTPAAQYLLSGLDQIN